MTQDAMSTNEALRAALARLMPVIEKGVAGLVFTADRAGEVEADMNTLRAYLSQPQEQAAEPVAFLPKWVRARIDKYNHCTADVAKNVKEKADKYFPVYEHPPQVPAEPDEATLVEFGKILDDPSYRSRLESLRAAWRFVTLQSKSL